MSLEGRPEAARSIRTIHAALDAGVTLIDTADAYQSAGDEVGHNEKLIAQALATWGGDTSGVLVTTKGGHVRVGEVFTLDGRLVSVSNQYSPAFRSSLDELRLSDELGISFLPWMPLGGIGKAGRLGHLFGEFSEVAAAHGVSPQQVTLAWILAHGEKVIPIPGASRPESIIDSIQAADLILTPEELARLDRAA